MKRKRIIQALALTVFLMCAPAAAQAEEGNTSAAFSDVPTDAYYSKAVSWAVAEGITRGTTSDSFSPEKTCTRAQVATFLWRAAGSPQTENQPSFQDVPSSAYYSGAVTWAVEKNVTRGTSSELFSPHRNCTKAQILTFLWRLAGEPKNGAVGQKMTAFRQHWAYQALRWAEAGDLLRETIVSFHPDAPCPRSDAVFYLYRYAQEAEKKGWSVLSPSERDSDSTGGQIVIHADSDESFIIALANLLKTYGNNPDGLNENDEYGFGRMLVKTVQALPDLSDYHPLQVLENADRTYYVIQFKDAADAQTCADYLLTLDYVSYVEPDRAMSIAAKPAGTARSSGTESAS